MCLVRIAMEPGRKETAVLRLADLQRKRIGHPQPTDDLGNYADAYHMSDL